MFYIYTHGVAKFIRARSDVKKETVLINLLSPWIDRLLFNIKRAIFQLLDCCLISRGKYFSY